MVKKLRRKVDIKEVIKERKEKEKVWMYPGHSREIMTVFLPDMDEYKLEKLRARKLKEFARKGYIELTDEDEIKAVFVKKANGKWNAFYEGRLMFMVWKYSQLLVAIEKEGERDKLFKRIDVACENEIINEVIESGICKRANFFDADGEPELSKSAQLVERDVKKNGIIWKAQKNKATHASRRNLDLYDLSLQTIKKAIDIRGLSLINPLDVAKKLAGENKAKAKKLADEKKAKAEAKKLADEKKRQAEQFGDTNNTPSQE